MNEFSNFNFFYLFLKACFYAAFISEEMSPLAGTLPSMFAKLSFLSSSIIYAYSNSITRREFKQVFALKIKNQSKESHSTRYHQYNSNEGLGIKEFFLKEKFNLIRNRF